jgi:hypothetical protein
MQDPARGEKERRNIGVGLKHPISYPLSAGLTKACRRRLEASTALRLSATPDARRYTQRSVIPNDELGLVSAGWQGGAGSGRRAADRSRIDRLKSCRKWSAPSKDKASKHLCLLQMPQLDAHRRIER